jgi:hypothetical protein
MEWPTSFALHVKDVYNNTIRVIATHLSTDASTASFVTPLSEVEGSENENDPSYPIDCRHLPERRLLMPVAMVGELKSKSLNQKKCFKFNLRWSLAVKLSQHSATVTSILLKGS